MSTTATRKGPKPKPLEERFWDLVDMPCLSDCWPWRGARQHPTRRYGKFKLKGGNGPTAYAHRLAYALTRGPIPPGMDVHHNEACTTQLCCNPSHLELVPREGHTLEHNTGGSEQNLHVPPGKGLEVRDGEAVLG